MTHRIAQAFRNPAALTDADIAALVAAMRKDAAQANKRRRRLENAGGTDGRDAERNAAYRRRRAELRALKTAWG
ncbi:hypothetical protein [Sulfitobacter pontiacus]|jgi:hypothetical protein|uniref:hypothetical protein n=1 Tax=Sulfitobacter pontiacus TaxID=60137 RepID=UPI002591C2B0|nr:hypothetical protein [uncultured Sulfitobacter sp.]